MIVEYIRYVLDAHSGDDLIAAYHRAQDQLRASPNARGWELTRCTDDPASFILRIEWDSAEGHMQGFRRSPEFPPFLAEIRPFIGEIAEMRHYELTSVRSDGATD